MLSVKSYSADYRLRCRLRLNTLLDGLATLSIPQKIELALCNELLLALDNSFCHRMRGQEGKGGNPLNEVRMLTNSILNNAAILAADNTIKYNAEKSVAGIALGSPIELDRAAFAKLSAAFFDEIDRRFP